MRAKLAISNIAWDKEFDQCVYEYMVKRSFKGLEIAPTRIFSQLPYDNVLEASIFAKQLMESYGLSIPSMQSIWFGKDGNIFVKEDAIELIEYTKKSILFAESIGCSNLVFGCPRNRSIPAGYNESDILPFFKEIAEFAFDHNTCIGLEANPTIYNTNFINYTVQAFDLVKKVNHPGLKVNIDLGTIIFNYEDLVSIKNNIDLVSHIHISEPNLAPIEQREIHKELAQIIKESSYDGFVSVEMKNKGDINVVKDTLNYIEGVFSHV